MERLWKSNNQRGPYSDDLLLRKTDDLREIFYVKCLLLVESRERICVSSTF